MKAAVVSEDDIERISKAWKDFGSIQNAWAVVISFEMTAIKSA
jgi:hypothetical protein